MSEGDVIIEQTESLRVAHNGVFHKSAHGPDPDVLTHIYNPETHIAVWGRSLPDSLLGAVDSFVDCNPKYRLSSAVTPANAMAALYESMHQTALPALCEDVAELVGMFCTLFGLERAGLRLRVLDSAMCPKFHVDRIPCRLVSTYCGATTEWLPHELVDRSKLGHGIEGRSDDESGLFGSVSDIQQLKTGDVALIKGDLWEGNKGRGLVHRSPRSPDGRRRLFLTLDFVN